MPTYEYLCEKCGHEFEREQRITDSPIKICPKCRGRKVKRLISQTSFVLKGSGWYADLYSSARQSKSGTGSADTSTSGSGSGSKPEKKPSAPGKTDGTNKKSAA